jgi:hypothetical protein
MYNDRNTSDIKLSSEFISAAHQLLQTLDITKPTTYTHTRQHCVPTLPTASLTAVIYSIRCPAIHTDCRCQISATRKSPDLINLRVSKYVSLHFTSHRLRTTSHNSQCWASGVPQTVQIHLMPPVQRHIQQQNSLLLPAVTLTTPNSKPRDTEKFHLITILSWLKNYTLFTSLCGSNLLVPFWILLEHSEWRTSCPFDTHKTSLHILQ